MKNAAQVKPKANIPAKKLAIGFIQKCPFVHAGCIGKMELKNMAAGFNMNTNTQWMVADRTEAF